jgi:hypothetical protein
VKDATLIPRIELTHAEGRHVHFPVDHGWQVEIHVRGAKSTIDLEGLVEPPRPGPGDFRIAPAARPPNRFRNGEGFHDTLGKLRYHRSEQDWAEAGSPTAEVHIVNERGRLHISADVHADRSFVPPETVNRLDNEQADINGAGIQLYVRSGYQSGGYVIVPVANSSKLSMRPIDGWGSAIAVEGSWREIPDGYHVDLYVSPPDAELSFAFAINEKPHGRERRRGQFVVPSSDSTEWIYLRGDRMPSRDMINIRLERD